MSAETADTGHPNPPRSASAPPPVDLTGEARTLLTAPYPLYARLLGEGPVQHVRLTGVGPCWMVLGHREVRAALADDRLRNDIRHSANWDDDGTYAVGPNMLQADPPAHTRLRRLVAREFTAHRVQALRPRVERIAGELADAVAREGRADLVEDFAFPLPITVICELLGVPAADRTAFGAWSTEIVAPSSPEAATAASRSMGAYLLDLIGRKRRTPSPDAGDLLHALVRTADEDGGALTADELLGMAFLLLVAGYETTANLISSAVRLLLTHPGQLAALRADRTLLEGAVEEALRYEPPAQAATFRYTAEPVTLAGVRIPPGETVLLYLAAANRDPARFPHPERFDITRDPAATRAHLSFGHGIHHCLGAPLARLEASIALRTLLERLPGLTLAEDAGKPDWRPGLLRGLRSLHVRW
ncbi:Cytochrome P450 [Streptomyces sp. WMMB 714]|uniref:cytochrome P450 family protein n=1 Tax=Streptomyces sp. WMMB 714 TaxID=1286822 RepID=UPI0008238C3C|nr:cytochrome P450 [Streptomyces sp. WMMB 714]SCK23273.1 Cytochrome P450 [Streptomyces sp. WMMB 714]